MSIDFNYEERFNQIETELSFLCDFKEKGYVLDKNGVWDLSEEQKKELK